MGCPKNQTFLSANSSATIGGIHMSEVIEENISTLGNVIIEPMVTVIGVGGAGSNIVDALKAHVNGIETVAVNTDAQHLFALDTDKKILIGRDVTKGLGARYPEVGAYAVENSIKEIEESLQTDVVVLVAGLGGGTGTGATPIIADIAKDRAITIAIAIMPFSHEGEHRKKVAEEGLMNLRDTAKTVMVLQNDSLLEFSDLKLTEVLVDIPKKLVANLVKGVIEQVSMSFLTTLEEELTEILREGEADELTLLNVPTGGEEENVAPVQFDETGRIETKSAL